MWALLIGNDDYPGSPLGGCVNDVRLVREYLNSYLNVPGDHICFFTNATRNTMINALYDLRDDWRIAVGDNIVIHYSGHGSSVDCDTYFTTPATSGGSMEAICPINRGSEVPDICERELNSVLSQLRDVKGPNITVILDCCHSGSSLHTIDSTATATITATVRYIPPSMPPHLAIPFMLAAADNNPRRNWDAPAVSDEAWEADLSSFVVLATCQDFQLAEEDNININGSRIVDSIVDVVVVRSAIAYGERGLRRSPQYGRFTWVLIKILESEEGNWATYDKVIGCIGRLGRLQVPVAVGSRKDSKLWFQ